MDKNTHTHTHTHAKRLDLNDSRAKNIEEIASESLTELLLSAPVG
jgi:hypothetical protein